MPATGCDAAQSPGDTWRDSLYRYLEALEAGNVSIRRFKVIGAASVGLDEVAGNLTNEQLWAIAVARPLLRGLEGTQVVTALDRMNIPPAPALPAWTAAAPALLAKIDSVIEALEAAKIDVKLTRPAPAGVAELLRLQTILIEASLLPLVKGLASSIEHEKGNASLLEEALTALKALEAKGLPAAQPTQSETYRPFKPKPAGVRRDDE